MLTEVPSQILEIGLLNGGCVFFSDTLGVYQLSKVSLHVCHAHPAGLLNSAGVGNWWLLRAQPCLARIHAVEGSSSGSEGSRHRNSSEAGPQSDQDTRRAEQAQREAEARLGTADYVEARGILQPATEYLHRAVQEATAQDSLTAQLLIMV
jgi:hypothetical protein